MVYKMIKTKYGVFLESLAITFVILLVGLTIGAIIENRRNSEVIDSYKNYEIEALDLRLQNYYYQLMNQSSCDAAIRNNFDFAEDLYLRGLQLEKFEEANQITDDLFLEKKRYVLLKSEFWLNALLLREKCRADFDTIVYFYSGTTKDLIMKGEQNAISNVLLDVKEKYGDDVLLIPLAGDLGLKIIDFQMQAYNVTELPSILINEKTVLTGFHTEEEIESYLR